MFSTEAQTDPRTVQGDIVPDEPDFDDFSERFGASSLTLKIGPLEMQIDGLSSRQERDLAERYRPFVVEGPVRPDVRIALRRARTDHFLRAPADGTVETYRMGCRRTDDHLSLWSYEFAGRLDRSERRAVLSIVEERGERFDRGLENFLRVLTAAYILEQGGMLLHASGVVRGGVAHLFFGPSGRGKTTVTLLSPGDVVLSDDLSLIVRNGERFEAAGIPFGMAHHRTPDTRDSFPIASLNSLVQAPDVCREPLTGARALAEICASLPFVMQETGQSRKALDVAGRLLEAVPSYRLRFRKEPSFWDVIEGVAQ
ncbi:MAG TPA: hypothetical protein VKF61_11975 [Candidatus Polarisedimenticolia bacterium]|nr:hypothetical protein [Candidatus Polarisedimenticolia bacterium]